MKVIGALVATVAVASANTIKLNKLGEGDHDFFHGQFTEFVREHNKQYEISEIPQKFAAFMENYKFIEQHNAANFSWKVGMNELGDLTREEYRAMLAYKGAPKDYAKSQNAYVAPEGQVTADAIDWRAKGAVTPIKNQGQCGSCWAFSSTGSIEGANQISTGKLVSLSEQQLVDCSTKQGNQGCNGGLMDQAFEYVIANKGLGSEDSYAYTGADGTCKTVPSVATVSGYTDVPKGDEKTMLSAIQGGPVSIAIEADHMGFQFYKSGVFDSALCGKKLDHGVLNVGYDTDSASGKDYWIVKNSWGETWGAKGYIWLARDKDMCGMADSASIPKV